MDGGSAKGAVDRETDVAGRADDGCAGDVDDRVDGGFASGDRAPNVADRAHAGCRGDARAPDVADRANVECAVDARAPAAHDRATPVVARAARPGAAGPAEALAAALGTTVVASRPVSGGSINVARRVDLADGRRAFLKFNTGAEAPMFAAEAAGLAWLADANALCVPRVVAVGGPFDEPLGARGGRLRSDGDRAHRFVESSVPLLALEWIEPGPRSRSFDADFGRGLALLHRAGAPSFGLDHDNVLATLSQDNTPDPTWPEFYAQRRLEPLLRRAIDRSLAPPGWSRRFARLFDRLPTLCGPPEPPARLHGDLWSGNVHATSEGDPCVLDPAVYGGHREIDLAMLQLFGAPSSTFFDAYDATYALASGRQERVPLWQLYPLLAHVCLFGGAYVSGVEDALRRVGA